MKYLPKFIIACALVALTPASGFAKDGAKCAPGSTTYAFSGGEIQCSSEIDQKNHIYIYLTPTRSNTTVHFSTMEFRSQKPVLVATISVEEKPDWCASWTNMQEVRIAINPKKVETTSLKGKTAYQKENITVFTPN